MTMNSIQKCLTTFFVFFCVYFDTGCLAETQTCFANVQKTFQNCEKCDTPQKLLRYATLHIANVEDKPSKQFLDHLFEAEVYKENAESIKTPNKFCAEIYKGTEKDKEYCKKFLEKSGFEMDHMGQNINRIFYSYSLEYLVTLEDDPENRKFFYGVFGEKAKIEYFGQIVNPVYEYMVYVADYLNIDESKLSAGKDISTFCSKKACSADLDSLFKGCTECQNYDDSTDVKHFINYMIKHIDFSSITDDFAKGFAVYLYTMVEPTTIEPQVFCQTVQSKTMPYVINYDNLDKHTATIRSLIVLNRCKTVLAEEGLLNYTSPSNNFYNVFFKFKIEEKFHGYPSEKFRYLNAYIYDSVDRYTIKPIEKDANEKDAIEKDANEKDANEKDANKKEANEKDANEKDANKKDANEKDANEKDANEKDANKKEDTPENTKKKEDVHFIQVDNHYYPEIKNHKWNNPKAYCKSFYYP